jgi:hypothetical protein
LVKSKSPKVPLFEDWLPRPTDDRITGASVRFGVEAVIVRDYFENHQVNLRRQHAPVRNRGETLRDVEGKFKRGLTTYILSAAVFEVKLWLKAAI